MKEINEFEQWAEDMSYDVNEGFDPEEFEGEVTVDDGEQVYYHAKVDNEQNRVHVTKCSDEAYRDECQADAEEQWADRDVDVPMEAKEHECPTCRGAGDYRDEEHKKHDCPDCEGEGKYVDEGKMKDLAMDMEELSDKEFEEKYQTKKSDWDEVKTPGLRQDPNKPAYIGKMKKFAGDLAAEAKEKFTQEEIQKAIRIAMHMQGNMTDATDAIDAIHPGLSQHPEVFDALTVANESAEVTEEYAPSVGDQIVTGKGTKGTIESVTDEAVEFRTETGKLLKTAISNVEPDAVNEDDVEEGNEFTLALANAKRDGKKEFEVDGKVYKVEENYTERLKTLINW
jgi:Zn finger protein HypA/HybF involved in hydrogenase expression